MTAIPALPSVVSSSDLRMALGASHCARNSGTLGARLLRARWWSLAWNQAWLSAALQLGRLVGSMRSSFEMRSCGGCRHRCQSVTGYKRQSFCAERRLAGYPLCGAWDAEKRDLGTRTKGARHAGKKTRSKPTAAVVTPQLSNVKEPKRAHQDDGNTPQHMQQRMPLGSLLTTLLVRTEKAPSPPQTLR